MYSYFFLISLIKTEENRDYMAGKIAEEYEKIKIKNFPKFGCEYSSNSNGYGMGEQENLIPYLKYFSSLFPDCILAYYHFYWNCQYLKIYTIAEGKVYLDEHNLENFKVGSYQLSSSYNIKHTQIPCNITSYINHEYKDEY